MELAQRAIDATAAERLYALCLDLSQLSDVRELTRQQAAAESPAVH
jgi:hypothetical protein